MKITIIYGTMGKSSVSTCVKLLLNRLKANINTDVDEFFLDKILPQVHTGFTSFFKNVNENIHFNSQYIHSLMESLDDANLIVLASPIYSLDADIQLKVLLDHISYNPMSYKCSLLRFNKVGLIISPTDDVNLHSTNRILKKSLRLLGVKKIFNISDNISSIKSENIGWTKKQKINNKISITSNKILASLNKSDMSKRLFFISFKLPTTKPVKSSNDLNVIYLNHFDRHRYPNHRKIKGNQVGMLPLHRYQ